MKQQKPKLIRGIIFVILGLLLVCFIFSNSAQSRSESIDQSRAVMNLVKPILDPHNRVSDDVFHRYLRKAAHFTEFAVLGFSLMGLSDCLPWKGKKKQRLAMPMLVSLFVAATDEIIQIFSPLRGPGISDVLLDLCGAAFGVACMAAFLLIITQSRMDNMYQEFKEQTKQLENKEENT